MKKVAYKLKKIVKFNLHTHSIYCDGRSTLSEYVAEGLRQRLDVIGFSSHAPVKFENHFSIKEEVICDYINEIKLLKEVSGKNISLLTGLECDFIPHYSSPFRDVKEKYDLDYIIGGVHLVENTETLKLWFIDGPIMEEYDRGLNEVFGGDIKKGVTRYFYQIMEMIETQEFDILAHFDKIKMHNAGRYFSEDDPWYRNLCLDVIELLKFREIIVEINTRGIYKKRCPDFYPSKFILENLLKSKVRITLSSDAHHSEELYLLLEDAANFAKSIGFGEVWCMNERRIWKAIPLGVK